MISSSRSSRLRSRAGSLAQLPLCELAAVAAPFLGLDIPYPGVFRERLFTPLRTFWLFLAQALSSDGTCGEAVKRALAWLAAGDEPEASPNTGAYCQARRRIKGPWLKAISQRAIKQLESNTPLSWLWLTHPVKLLDGSSFSMPDTAENQARWPQPKGQKSGCGFPVARIVGIFSLATGAWLALVTGSLRVSERALFRRLRDSVFQPGDVALADRGFCGFAEIYELLCRGVHCVMRRHQRLTHGVGLARWRRLGKRDWLLQWRRSSAPSLGYNRDQWKALPESIRIREITVRVEIPGFRTTRIALLTTLLDPKAYRARAFADLYRRRWEVETDLRHIKTTLRMEVLRCKSPDMIEKELTMHQIAYNLIRALMGQAAQTHGVDVRRISFKGTVDGVRQWAGMMSKAQADDLPRLHQRLLSMIARHPVPARPNRREPRAIKRRPKNYARLVMPRAQYREILHRNKYTKAMRGDE